MLTKEEPGIWQKLSPNMQKLVKEQLLEGIKEEKDRSLNKKVGPTCLTSHTPPSRRMGNGDRSHCHAACSPSTELSCCKRAWAKHSSLCAFIFTGVTPLSPPPLSCATAVVSPRPSIINAFLAYGKLQD